MINDKSRHDGVVFNNNELNSIRSSKAFKIKIPLLCKLGRTDNHSQPRTIAILTSNVYMLQLDSSDAFIRKTTTNRTIRPEYAGPTVTYIQNICYFCINTV